MYGRDMIRAAAFSSCCLPPLPRRPPRLAVPPGRSINGSPIFEREAMAQGISQATIAAAAPYLTYDQRIVYIDRGQRVFTQTFLEFSDRMAAAYRIQRGQALIKKYAARSSAASKQRYGVPAPVIVAFWGLESDFGANMGNYHSLPSLVVARL